MSTSGADWQQLVVEPGRLPPAVVADVLEAAGAIAVTLVDAGDQPILEPAPGTTPLWARTRVVGLWPGDTDAAALAGRLRDLLGTGAGALSVERLDDRQWELEWRRDYRPMRFGRRLWVAPPDEPPPEGADAVTVRLEPGLAFGTGTHPTTALCLEWLEAHVRPGQRVLDYGCGSGILAIAALRLGAGHATAVDVDPQAIIATTANAEVNEVADRLEAALVENARAPGRYDVVVANILAGPLAELASTLGECVAPGGSLVLSGLLEDQVDAVVEAYGPVLRLAPAGRSADWVLLAGRRSKGH